MTRDTLADIRRDMLVFLGNATTVLDDAERLLLADDMGTEKWAAEVDAWRKAKRAVTDCDEDE